MFSILGRNQCVGPALWPTVLLPRVTRLHDTSPGFCPCCQHNRLLHRPQRGTNIIGLVREIYMWYLQCIGTVIYDGYCISTVEITSCMMRWFVKYDNSAWFSYNSKDGFWETDLNVWSIWHCWFSKHIIHCWFSHMRGFSVGLSKNEKIELLLIPQLYISLAWNMKPNYLLIWYNLIMTSTFRPVCRGNQHPLISKPSILWPWLYSIIL